VRETNLEVRVDSLDPGVAEDSIRVKLKLGLEGSNWANNVLSTPGDSNRLTVESLLSELLGSVGVIEEGKFTGVELIRLVAWEGV
jgi:hypothetical protein